MTVASLRMFSGAAETAPAICTSAEGTCAARLLAAANTIQPTSGKARIIVLALLGERNLEPIRVGEHEDPGTPRHVGRLLIQHDPACFGARRETIEILRRVKPQPYPDPLHPVAALLEVILGEDELGGSGPQLYPGQLALFFPLVLDDESQPFSVE